MDKWYLWGFITENGLLIITRGRTQYEAEIWASYQVGRYKTFPVNVLPTNASEAYTRNHPFDWFNIPPQWYQKVS